jgi:hypothetical protein
MIAAGILSCTHATQPRVTKEHAYYYSQQDKVLRSIYSLGY